MHIFFDQLQIKKVKTERVELYIDAQSSCFGIHEFKRPPFVCSKTFSTRFKLFRPSGVTKLNKTLLWKTVCPKNVWMRHWMLLCKVCTFYFYVVSAAFHITCIRQGRALASCNRFSARITVKLKQKLPLNIILLILSTRSFKIT